MPQLRSTCYLCRCCTSRCLVQSVWVSNYYYGANLSFTGDRCFVYPWRMATLVCSFKACSGETVFISLRMYLTVNCQISLCMDLLDWFDNSWGFAVFCSSSKYATDQYWCSSLAPFTQEAVVITFRKVNRMVSPLKNQLWSIPTC